MLAVKRTYRGRTFSYSPLNRKHWLNQDLLAWWRTGAAQTGCAGNSPAWIDFASSHVRPTTIKADAYKFAGSTRDGGYNTARYGSGNAAPTPSGTITVGNTYTVSAWARRATGTPNGHTRRIVATDFRAGFFLGSKPDGSEGYKFVVNDIGLSGPSGGDSSDGRWHHVCGVYDSQHAYLYVDGVIVGSPVSTSPIGLTTKPVTLSNAFPQVGQSFGDTYAWAGWLNDVRIVGRAYTANQVADLYRLSNLNYPGVLLRVDVAVNAEAWLGGGFYPIFSASVTTGRGF